jgi:hypothetical protein
MVKNVIFPVFRVFGISGGSKMSKMVEKGSKMVKNGHFLGF